MRAHRSHSQLNAYLYCGHQYYLTRVLHKPEAPSVWLAGGKAFHSATENFDHESENFASFMTESRESGIYEDAFTAHFEREMDQMRLVEPDEKKWRTAGRATKEKPNKEDVLWWHTAGRGFVAAYIDWRIATADVWEVAMIGHDQAIEVEVTLPLGDVPMKGFIDRIFRSKLDGRLIVADLKSGTRTPASPMQLATYSVQVEPLINEPVLWGAWYDARKGALGEPINLASWTKPKLDYVYESLDRGIQAGIFLPNIDTHCVGCGVAKFCIYNGGNENA